VAVNAKTMRSKVDMAEWIHAKQEQEESFQKRIEHAKTAIIGSRNI